MEVALVGLVGVIIGSILTPFAHAWVENKKAKAQVVAEIVRWTYMIFSYKKDIVWKSNQLDYDVVLLVILKRRLLDANGENERAVLHKDIFHIEENVKTYKSREAFNSATEAEAHLLAASSQVRKYFKRAVSLRIDEIVDQILSMSNRRIDLYQYEQLSGEELDRLKYELGPELFKVNDRLDAECQQRIEEIKKLLSRK